MRRIETSFIVALVTIFIPNSATSYDRVFNEAEVNHLSSIYETYFELEAGGTYIFWVDSLVHQSIGAADTQMHLVDWQTKTWLRSNDDCDLSGYQEGLNSCIEYTNQSSSMRFVKVVVHTFSDETASEGVFHASGPGIVDPAVSAFFGGQVFDNLDWLAEDRFQFVQVMNGLVPGSSFRVYLAAVPMGNCVSSAWRLYRWGDRGIAKGMTFDVDEDSNAFCIRHLVIGLSLPVPELRRARFFINDQVRADSDSDGLGDDLELQLHTCGGVGATYCPPSTKNPADTDHDGLADGWEVLGYAHPDGDVMLPFLGADPRHKDVYLEIDTNKPLASPSFIASQAEHLATIFEADLNSSVGNPDGTPGLRIHVDNGFSSCDSAGENCSTTSGNWGGADSVDYPNGDCYSAGEEHMALQRRGIFRYALATGPAGDGEAGGGWLMKFEAASTGMLAHELGHSLGLGHGGKTNINGKPAYTSLMNYAFPWNTRPVAFSNGEHAPLVSTNLNELSQSAIDLDFIGASYDFTVVDANIDWNRNGVFDVGQVNGVTRWPFGGSVGTPFVHRSRVFASSGGEPTIRGDQMTAIADFNGLHAFGWGTDGMLYYSSFEGNITPCTGTSDPTPCCPMDEDSYDVSCGAWNPAEIVGWHPITSAPAAAVAHVAYGDTDALVVAYKRPVDLPNPTFRLRFMEAEGVFSYEFPTGISDSHQDPYRGDPVLLTFPNVVSESGLWLFYLSSTGHVRARTFDGALGIGVDYELWDVVAGHEVESWFPPAVALDSDNDLVGIVTVDIGDHQSMHYYVWYGTNADVYPVNAFTGSGIGPSITTSRPTLVFDSANEPHGFYLFFAVSDHLKMAWQSADSTFGHEGFLLERRNNQNKGGIAVTVHKGYVSGAYGCFGGLPGICNANTVWHVPFANGVVPLVENDYDDFVWMGERMCSGLASALGGCSICVAPGVSCIVGPPSTYQCDFRTE